MTYVEENLIVSVFDFEFFQLALVEIQPNHGFSHVFHDTDLMSRLTQDVYAIQFPSSNGENSESTTETNQSSSSSSSPSSASNNHFVNLLILNRVKTIAGRYERFGAPIGKRIPLGTNNDPHRTFSLLQRCVYRENRTTVHCNYRLSKLNVRFFEMKRWNMPKISWCFNYH